MNWYFLYSVEIYSIDSKRTEHESGITFAPTYAEAMAKIEQYYDNDLCQVNYLEMREEGEVYPLNEDAMKAILG